MEAASTISLVDLDPELAVGLPPVELARARQRTQVACLTLEPGEWAPVPAATIAILVLDGILVRELVLAGTPSAELLGAGDIAAISSSGDEFLPTSVRWTVVSPTRVVLVNERVAAGLPEWPRLVLELLSRAAQQTSRLSLQRAIAHLPRVEDRLLALFWHLAERWGRVGRSGVIVPLSLTHTMLGRLVGARRPTVSLALKELEQRGTLARRDDGSWVVGLESLSSLESEDLVDAASAPRISLVDVPEVASAGGRRGPRPVAGHVLATTTDPDTILRRIAEMRDEHQMRLAAVEASMDRARAAIQHSRALRERRRSGTDPFSRPAP